MANQIVVSAGAKVRNLQDVIIGTSGVLTSLGFDVANGVPRLDVNGKILVSQLPNSVMEYKGTWNAATNTPTLVNGTGNQGDVYLCNVAGTVDFGAGAIAFVVGDQVIYSGSIWQRASGSTGTVTSVAVTESGDSLNITGSPITTSGTINIGFNGTNLQYVNGAGNLTTFPTLITSIGLTMPSAFSVANSPLTANGTIAVTGAGVASQYIRGDGTLADFPSSGGGGSSVSYYLNGGTSQGTIGGTTYYEMSKTAVIGTGVDFPKTGDGFIVAFLTDANDPAQLNIPAGNWNYEIYAQMSANGGTPQMYAELYKYDGTTFTLISTSSNEIIYDGTALNLYTFAMAVPDTSLTLTDRLAVKLYATNSGGKTTTIHTQDGHLCQIITTFSTGITALNGLTAQVQYFQTGTSGTDFNISSTTATHTFNIPDASATARGLITTGTQTIAGAKTFNANPSINVAGQASLSILSSTGNSALIFGYVNNVLKGTIDINATEFKFASTINSTYKFQASGLGIASLIFNNTTNYSYTFPAATGTLALTSDLGAYLPLAGGTMTGAIVGTTSTFTNGGSGIGVGITLSGASGDGLKITHSAGRALNIASSGAGYGIIINNETASTSAPFTIQKQGSNVITMSDTGAANFTGQLTLGSTITNGSSTYTLPSATGTLALTSSLSGYLPLTGGTLTGALGGTSASFSGALTVTNNVTIRPTSGYNAYFQTSGTALRINYLNDALSANVSASYRATDFAWQKGDGTEVLKLDSSGNLGLGVTPSAWYSAGGYASLQVGNASLFGRNSANSELYLSANAFDNSSGNPTYITTDFATRYAQNDGVHSWLTAPSGTAGNAITFTQAMTLNASGNLGLGTPTPDVFSRGYSGKILGISSAGQSAIGLNAATGSAAYFDMGVNGTRYLSFYTDTTSSDISTIGAYALTLSTNSVARLTIASTGAATFSSSVTATNITNNGIYYGRANASFPATSLGYFALKTNNLDGERGGLTVQVSNSTSTFIDALTINYTGAATFSSTCTATGFFESSDSRLKTLIQDNYQTKGIASITPKLYTKNGKVELGYYAQDFVGVLDSAISKDEDEMLSLSYREVLVAKVYALEQRIKELEAKFN
jgi:hypothetical protein